MLGGDPTGAGSAVASWLSVENPERQAFLEEDGRAPSTLSSRPRQLNGVLKQPHIRAEEAGLCTFDEQTNPGNSEEVNGNGRTARKRKYSSQAEARSVGLATKLVAPRP